MEMSPLQPPPKEHEASLLYIPTQARDTVLPSLELAAVVPTLVCRPIGCPLLAFLLGISPVGALGLVVFLQLFQYSFTFPSPSLNFRVCVWGGCSPMQGCVQSPVVSLEVLLCRSMFRGKAPP